MINFGQENANLLHVDPQLSKAC